MHATPMRRRIAGATMALGAILLGMSLFAPSANAGVDAPAFFDAASYDTTLHEPHRGTSADASGFSGTCPTNVAVEGLTAWHLILTDNGGKDYSTLDVRVLIDGTGVTLSGLTPKAKDDWVGFDPTLHFMADPSLKHAYVYAGDADDVLVDAAAQVTPDGPADKIVLSHICPGDEGTTDGGDDGGDDGDTSTAGGDDGDTATTGDTGDVQATSGSQDPAPETEVLGNVVVPQTLPKTGDNDQSLAIIGGALVLIGGGVLLIRRDLLGRS